MEPDSARLLAADIPIVRAPMTGVQVSHDIFIAAPAATVWGVTADVSAWPSWSPTVTSVENRGDGPLTEGMIVSLKQPFQPARSWIILHCEALHALILGTVEGNMVARHQIANTSRGTLSRLTLDYAGPFPKLLRPALRMALRMENSGLKRRCEALSQGARATTAVPICDGRHLQGPSVHGTSPSGPNLEISDTQP